jgi:hypothetical protein
MRALPSQTELLRFVDRLALARASELARAGGLREASRVLLEDPTLRKRSPEACDLLARICFRLGYHDNARFLWKRAVRLSGGAGPYCAMLALCQDYAAWQKRRRRALVRALAWRRVRRVSRSLAARVTDGLVPWLKRKTTGLLCRPKKTQPTALPATPPTAPPTPALPTTPAPAEGQAAPAEPPAPAPERQPSST